MGCGGCAAALRSCGWAPAVHRAVVAVGEREGGEIEEGEAAAAGASPPVVAAWLDSDSPEEEEEEEGDGGFDRRVGAVLGELEMVNAEEAEKSFGVACSRLHKCFGSLKSMFPETGKPMPLLDALVQRALIGIDIVAIVASLHNSARREQNKDRLLKVLLHIKNQYSYMLTPDQQSKLDSHVDQLVLKDSKNSTNGQRATIGTVSTQASSKRLPIESRTANSFSTPMALNRGAPRNRMAGQWLDLNSHYDERSLPSPTQDTAPPSGHSTVPKPGPRRRGPRLRFRNRSNGTAPNRKRKAVDDLVVCGCMSKRARNGVADLSHSAMFEAKRSPDVDLRTHILPALLEGIAADPTVFMQFLRMEQRKRSASEAQQNAPESTPKGAEVARVPNKRAQMSPQTAPLAQNPQNGAGVIRLKPRDPRWILHTTIARKNDSEQLETEGNIMVDSKSSKNCPTIHEQQGEQPQINTSSPSEAEVAPASDVSQLTKNQNSNSELPAASLLASHQSSVHQSSDGKTDGQNTDQDANAVPMLCADPWGGVDLLLEGFDDEQKALIQEERARRIVEQRKMFAARKLCLVLDLDHTLLNSAKFTEVDPAREAILRQMEKQDRKRPQRHLFRLQHLGIWTKLRPGIWNFLQEANKLYELHLCTMGNKVYAAEMAKILDPTGSLFAGRVTSRGDDDGKSDSDDRAHKCKDLSGVLGMESAIIIIDDTVRVWPHNKLNLITVERYTYFPCGRRQFGLPGPSLLEVGRDERPEDGTLASSLAVIGKIHEGFFAQQSLEGADVRSLLAAEQQRILAGCRIAFSRVFPLGEARPQSHPLWQTAEQFGAVCTNQIDERVTHVVAASLGTDKVKWALATGRFVVHPGWVEASALLYRRAKEQDFKPLRHSTPPQPPKRSIQDDITKPE